MTSDRVLIIGTGLIGGSLGMAARRRGIWVAGHDRDPTNAHRARELGALDQAIEDPSADWPGVDTVFVATPVGQVCPAIAELARYAPLGTVVTDVGSAKGRIVAEAESLLGESRPFVGGHPMAGTEGEGIDAARPELFDGALWILTPTASTAPAAFSRIHGIVTRIGARTLALEPGEHDRLVALVSHLPYALATVLMELAGKEGDERVFQAAAGTFRDVTRTAGSNPRMWRDILEANREAVLREVDVFATQLGVFREALSSGDWDRIDALIAEAREARRRFPLKAVRRPAEPITLEIPVPDRAGVLAEITTALGELGVNIEDLWMDHTPGGGLVRLIVDGRTVADRVAAHLGEHGFHVTAVEES